MWVLEPTWRGSARRGVTREAVLSAHGARGEVVAACERLRESSTRATRRGVIADESADDVGARAAGERTCDRSWPAGGPRRIRGSRRRRVVARQHRRAVMLGDDPSARSLPRSRVQDFFAPTSIEHGRLSLSELGRRSSTAWRARCARPPRSRSTAASGSSSCSTAMTPSRRRSTGGASFMENVGSRLKNIAAPMLKQMVTKLEQGGVTPPIGNKRI